MPRWVSELKFPPSHQLGSAPLGSAPLNELDAPIHPTSRLPMVPARNTIFANHRDELHDSAFEAGDATNHVQRALRV
jgi:hypothetical protein